MSALAACDPGTPSETSAESPAIVLTQPVAPAPDVLLLGGRTRSTNDPFDLFSGSDVGRALSEHLRAATRFDDFAARRHRMSLARLKTSGPQFSRRAIAELAAAYARLPELAFDQRWLMVETLGELEDTDALAILFDVAGRAVPPEQFALQDTSISSREEEITIRLAAVRGIARLSQLGDRDADDRLLTLARTSRVLAIQLQAVQGYLNGALLSTRAGSLAAYRQTRAFQARADVVRTLPRNLQAAITAEPMPRTSLSPIRRTTTAVRTPAPIVHR